MLDDGERYPVCIVINDRSAWILTEVFLFIRMVGYYGRYERFGSCPYIIFFEMDERIVRPAGAFYRTEWVKEQAMGFDYHIVNMRGINLRRLIR